MLVGDAEAYGMLRPLTGTVPPLAPEQLVLPAGAAGGGGALGPSALPDDAVLCNCHNVTKGTVRAAVTEHSCGTLPEIKKCTKAGTGCGSCVKSLTAVMNDELAASGVSLDTGLCGCFPHTRAELYEIVRTLRLTSFAELLDSHGRPEARHGDGCEICKPTVGSIIASLAPAVGAAAMSSTASRPPSRTPTTTSSPTSSATARTPSCRASPAGRSPRRS